MNDSWSHFLPAPDPALVARTIANAERSVDELWMVLVAEGGAPDLDTIVQASGAVAVPFFGGLFPEILHDGQRQKEGVLLIRLRGLSPPILIRDLTDASNELSALAANLPDESAPPATALILVDGLSANISALIEGTYDRLGARVHYWGGGAGSMTFEPTRCVFTAEGPVEGGAVAALSSFQATLGVRHGWRAHRGPLVATRTRGNLIEQLNWRPAAEVYLEQLGVDDDPSAHARVTRAHPLGIQRQGEELVVRDPVAVTPEGGLMCVGDVPQNAVLSILAGDAEDLIVAAGKAALDAVPQGATVIRHRLLADCISRVLFLGDRFADELAAIDRAAGDVISTAPACGVLTLGEISSRGDGCLEFFNKTCVVAVLHES